MRCKACDKLLSDYESTRKSAQTNEFLDLCNHCYTHVKEEIMTLENQELLSISDILDFDDEL